MYPCFEALDDAKLYMYNEIKKNYCYLIKLHNFLNLPHITTCAIFS